MGLSPLCIKTMGFIGVAVRAGKGKRGRKSNGFSDSGGPGGSLGRRRFGAPFPAWRDPRRGASGDLAGSGCVDRLRQRGGEFFRASRVQSLLAGADAFFAVAGDPVVSPLA